MSSQNGAGSEVSASGSGGEGGRNEGLKVEGDSPSEGFKEASRALQGGSKGA